MIQRNTLLYLLIVASFLSCKKNNEPDSPVVQILAPSGLSVYSVFDTILVKAHISDAVNLQSVAVSVDDSQQVQVLPAVTVPITSNNMTFICPYVINNIHLASGKYTIVVGANNGTNVTLGFRQIYINAAPTVREGIFAITRNSSGLHILKIDTNFNISPVYTLSGDYSSSDISSYYQQLYIGAADSGNINVLSSMPSVSLAWGITGYIAPNPCFTNVYSYADAVYISEYSGYIKYYNSSGVLESSITITSGYYPIKTSVWSNYLFAEEQSISSPARNFVLYNMPINQGFEQNSLPGPVVAMFGMDNNNLFVFGNQSSGGAYLQLFNISYNIFSSPVTLPTGNMLSATQINAQTYLMGFDNGIIYQYTYNPYSFAVCINGVTASRLQFDYADNEIIAASGENVYEYSYPSLKLFHTANTQDSVLNVLILYNK
ncbi:MAG: Ig-like domain-containing protein [Bacteroidia bacterium]